MSVIIFQIISVIINVYLAFCKNIKDIFIINFLFNLAQLLMYLFNDDLTTTLVYIIIVVRSFLYIYKEKFKTNTLPWIIISLQLIVGFCTIENGWQLLSILIPCYSCYYLWYGKDTQELRIGNMVINGLWGVYNGVNCLFIVMIMRIITFTANLIAYTKEKRKILK